MTKFMGLILDFNGVLLWDTPMQDQAWTEISTILRGTPLASFEMESMVHGRPNKNVFEYLLGKPLNSTSTLHKLTDMKESKYRELCLSNPQNFILSPGAIELLNFLVEHNIPHTIATSSERTNLDFFIKHLKLDDWFDTSKVVYDDGTLIGKPNPDVYLKAANNIKLSPENCVVVEDAISGIKAAQQANIGRVYAISPLEKHEIMTQVDGIYKTIVSLKEVPENIFEIKNTPQKKQTSR